MGRKRIYDVDLIKKLYLEENKTIKQIADETGYNYNSIATVISREKISKHGRSSNSIVDDVINKALKLSYIGFSKEIIALVLDISIEDIYKYNKELHKKDSTLKKKIQDISVSDEAVKCLAIANERWSKIANPVLITDGIKEAVLNVNEEIEVKSCIKVEEPVILENKEEEKIEKPYEVLYDNFVFYKGRIYEILKGDELRDVLYPLLVKKKLPPKKKGRKCRSNYTSL